MKCITRFKRFVNIKASVESYKEAPKANVVTKEEERIFIERYTQQQLNIKDEPVILNVGPDPQ